MSAHGNLASSRPTRPRRRRTGKGPLHTSLSFGRVAGIEIGANWTWPVVFALVVWSLADTVFPQESPGLGDGAYIAMAAIGATLFFGSLVLHELGHAIVARREGMEIDGITLWIFGGVARFKGMFPSAGAEFRIAIAGPLVSLAIAVLLLLLVAIAPLPGSVEAVASWLGAINLVLLAFNLLPALPLDGGRVLRSLLWRSSGDFLRSTVTAGRLGNAFGQVMIGGGVALLLLAGLATGIWLAFIGWFLTMAAAAETSLATMRSALAGYRVSDAMVRWPVTLPAELTLDRFVADVFPSSRYAAYPVKDAGGVAGVLPFRKVAAVPRERWAEVKVADTMIPVDEALVLRADQELADAALELSESELRRALVLDGTRLAGLLSITDVSRLLELKRMQAP